MIPAYCLSPVPVNSYPLTTKFHGKLTILRKRLTLTILLLINHLKWINGFSTYSFPEALAPNTQCHSSNYLVYYNPPALSS